MTDGDWQEMVIPEEPKTRADRHEYPLCPLCGGPVVAAMMTSNSITIRHRDEQRTDTFYHPEALSMYCCSAACNYDMPLTWIPYPPPAEDSQ